ncbi:hypothetical protein P7K49_016017, partial [Saguinus oedipus]
RWGAREGAAEQVLGRRRPQQRTQGPRGRRQEVASGSGGPNPGRLLRAEERAPPSGLSWHRLASRLGCGRVSGP